MAAPRTPPPTLPEGSFRAFDPPRRGRVVLKPFGHHNFASPSRVREGRPRSGRGGSSGIRHGLHDQQRGSPLRAFGPTLPEGE